ncbi:MAG: AAA family ATPase [Phycisphaeraceae bacterium]|nr:AAA family ATPase [Phycisphaeraceae bacterium]
MRAIVTGQVGMDKRPYLQRVVQLASERGESVALYNVGQMMYAEAPDLSPGRILDLPLSRLSSLRRSAFKDIITESAKYKHILVNTHATFRWRHGLFSAFDFDQARALAPDMLICLVDNIEVVHRRLHGEHTLDVSLKDLMVWREEEIMATELLAQALGCAQRFYILARGRHEPTVETVFRLVCRPTMRKVYPSFPMTHVVGMPAVLAEINDFRRRLAEQFITFDPGDVDEKLLLDSAIAAATQSRDFIQGHGLLGDDTPQSFPVSVKQVLDIAGDIDGQIYARDFKLIDQSDMIVSYVPELPAPAIACINEPRTSVSGESPSSSFSGRSQIAVPASASSPESFGIPGLSSGVERELQHAHEHGKEVYVVWRPRRSPSPFVTETATKVFKTTDEALDYFRQKNMFQPPNLFGA